jgi:bacteriocin-like protein
MTHFNNLSDDNLEQVTGGMGCGDAITLASFYMGLAKVLGALGDAAGSSNASGKGQGVLTGACPSH